MIPMESLVVYPLVASATSLAVAWSRGFPVDAMNTICVFLGGVVPAFAYLGYTVNRRQYTDDNTLILLGLGWISGVSAATTAVSMMQLLTQ